MLGESRNCLPRPLPIEYLTGGLALYNQLLATKPLNPPTPPPLPISLLRVVDDGGDDDTGRLIIK